VLKALSKLKISFRKLGELEFQCYQNALRLHSDSILLYTKDSFASAFALSVLANEEFGKGFAIAEICFHAKFENRFGPQDEHFLRALLSDHKLKQGWFRSYVFGGILTHKRFIKHFARIQFEKNNAFYVGVRERNHQIVRPFLLPKSKARNRCVSPIRLFLKWLKELWPARNLMRKY